MAFSGLPVLHGVDLVVERGESLGFVGESGCGKSVTWKAALRLLPRSVSVSGRVVLEDTDLLAAPPAVLDRVRGGRAALIFQDPTSALNPVHRIGAQIAEALRLHRGLYGTAAREEARRLLDDVGIPDARNRIHAYPHELSGGQNQRVMIAIALAGKPDLLIADEPTTALDTTVQAQILELLRQIQSQTGMALVLISHDLGVVATVCERVCVMYAGRIVEDAPTDRLLAFPAHPYTRDLIAAIPPMSGPRRRLAAIDGSPPQPGNLPAGCAYAPRCGAAIAACRESSPPMRPLGQDRLVRCIRAEEQEFEGHAS